MFGKLLKHEFLATGRIMAIVYGVIAVLSAYILGSFFLGDKTIEEMNITEAFSILLLFLVALVNVVLTIVVTMSNFQKSLYGDQGYLTFTLPVKSFPLLSSKIFVATFWYILAAFTTVAASMIVMSVAERNVGETGIGMIEMLLGLYDPNLSIGIIIFWFATYLINFFFTALLMTLEVCFAITISNTRPFQKHHVLFTLLFSGIAIAVVSKIITAISDAVTFGFNYNIDTKSMEVVTNILDINMSFVDLVNPILTIVLTVVFFIATHFVMSKKVNIR